ncbi:hypothetical protein HYH02_000533 [Chlamydomonas schloesseri]|uniref:Uncharacterized protein n=1 Tax=Chlamydomonas schloesseri TaxID=2026947 RepID=A0A835WY33_9CHLO|nr:hypothetical protein HYH02_000533 [Chlamydomonas schloesseri]|eukprot:KAG2454696.1 hypothetical protein HYH02_000533 [Chlamydomonas schloesseri]
MGAAQSASDGVLTVVEAPGQSPVEGPHHVALAELQAHVDRLGEQLQAIKLQGEGPTAWALTTSGVTSTLPVIGSSSPGPKRAPAGGAAAAQGAASASGRAPGLSLGGFGGGGGNVGGGGGGPPTPSASTAQDWLILGLGLGGNTAAAAPPHPGAASAIVELQAAAAGYRRWFAEREAAAARRQAALHVRLGQVAAETRDTVAALARVTEANKRTAATLGLQLRPVAEGVESLAARLEAAATELRGCRQAIRAYRQRQQELGAAALASETAGTGGARIGPATFE